MKAVLRGAGIWYGSLNRSFCWQGSWKEGSLPAFLHAASDFDVCLLPGVMGALTGCCCFRGGSHYGTLSIKFGGGGSISNRFLYLASRLMVLLREGMAPLGDSALLEEAHYHGGGLSGLMLKQLPVRERASFWLPVEESLLIPAFGSKYRTLSSFSSTTPA